MERAIDDGVNSFKALTRDARVLPAGGAVELELSKALFEFGRKQTGLDQYAIAKFALALEVEPSAAPTAMQKLRIVTLGISGGRSLTTPLRDARRFPSTRWYPVPGATRTTLGFGICSSFKDPSLSRRAQP
jgi:hypothetical protein